MKKNLIIIAVTIFCVFAIEGAAVLTYTNGKLRNKCTMVMKQNRQLRDEIKSYEEILDSIDNAHHHDYLTTINGYKKLRPAYESLRVVR